MAEHISFECEKYEAEMENLVKKLKSTISQLRIKALKQKSEMKEFQILFWYLEEIKAVSKIETTFFLLDWINIATHHSWWRQCSIRCLPTAKEIHRRRRRSRSKRRRRKNKRRRRKKGKHGCNVIACRLFIIFLCVVLPGNSISFNR